MWEDLIVPRELPVDLLRIDFNVSMIDFFFGIRDSEDTSYIDCLLSLITGLHNDGNICTLV